MNTQTCPRCGTLTPPLSNNNVIHQNGIMYLYCVCNICHEKMRLSHDIYMNWNSMHDLETKGDTNV